MRGTVDRERDWKEGAKDGKVRLRETAVISVPFTEKDNSCAPPCWRSLMLQERVIFLNRERGLGLVCSALLCKPTISYKVVGF